MSRNVLFWQEDESPILARGSVASLTGPTGSAKTRLAVRMMARLATGHPWIGGIRGHIDGRIAFVSLKDSIDDLKRMVLEECNWAGIAPAELVGKIELVDFVRWRDHFATSCQSYSLIIVDDASRDGQFGVSLGDTEHYVVMLRQLASRHLPGRPAMIVVQGLMSGVWSICDFTECNFSVSAPTCELGVARSDVGPWSLGVDSDLAYEEYHLPFRMTPSGIKEI